MVNEKLDFERFSDTDAQFNLVMMVLKANIQVRANG